MFRKIALGLIAVASITAASLAPASAKGGFHGHWGHGWGHGHGFIGGPSFVVGGGGDCYERVLVQTRHGARFRVVNTCGYIY